MAARAGSPAQKEAGLVVALDVQNGKHTTIHGMGRHNHENSVPIPGYHDLAVLSGDDTFTSGPLTIPLDSTGRRTSRRRSRSCTRTSRPTPSRCWRTLAPRRRT